MSNLGGGLDLPKRERSLEANWLLGCLLTILAACWAVPASGEEIEVTGRLLAPDTHALAGVRVTLSRLPGSFEQARRLADAKPETAAAEAEPDEQGFFRLTAPESGMWTVRAETPGFLPMEIALKPLVRETALPPLTLERDAVLRVTLSDGDRPIRNALVRAELATPRSSRYGARTDWTDAPRLGRTDDHGVAVLPWGGETVRILASAVDFALEERTLRRPELRMVLSRRPPLGVEVRNPQGAPVPNAVIRSAEKAWTLAETREDGRATIHASAGFEVEVLAHGGLGFRGSLPKPSEDGIVRVDLAPPTLLSGRVVERREPVPIAGALVWAAGDPGSFRRTDGRGGYELPVRGNGRTTLAAAARSFFTALQPVDLAAVRGDLPTLALEAMAEVAGVVTDSHGEALPEVEILAFPDPKRRTRTGYLLSTSGGPTYSSAAGRFEIRRLLHEVAYRARFRKAGYALAEIELPVVLPGETPPPLAVTLLRGRSAFGHVVDADEVPVAGAEVRLRPAPSDEAAERIAETANPYLVPAWDAATGRDGRFEIADLPAGSYFLTVRAVGFAPLQLPGLSVAERDAVTDLGTVVLVPGAVVEGFVRNTADAPLDAVEVRIAPTGSAERTLADLYGDELPADALTGPDGYFVLRDRVPGERLELRFHRRGYARHVLPGIEAPSEEPLAVVLGPVSRVVGRVADGGGNPIDGADLLLDRPETSLSAGGTTTVAGTNVRETKADEDGRFAFEEVEPGEVVLSASAPGYANGEWTGLEVAADKDLELELALEPGASVRGTVFGPDSEALAGVFVRYQSAGSGNRVRTDGEGVFRIEGAAVGRLKLTADDERYGRAVHEADLVAGENVVDLRFERGLEIQGTVVDETGAGVAGAVVRWMKEGDYVGVRRQTSTEGGAFRFEGVSPGPYVLSASREGFAGTPERLTVEVGEESLDGLVVRLVVGATLTGRLLGLAVDELASVEVAVGPYSKAMQVDPDGTFRITNVLPGVWTVVARHAASERQASAEVTIEPGDAEVRLDLEFGTGRRLTGRVMSHGEGVAGNLAVLFGADGLPVAQSKTNAAGAFVFRGLREGTYRLHVLDPRGGAERSEQIEILGDREIIVELDQEVLAGFVVRSDDASPLGGVRVTLEGADGRTGRETTTDARGRFQFLGVAKGSWRLVAGRDGYEPSERTVQLGQEAAGTEIRIALVPSAVDN